VDLALIKQRLLNIISEFYKKILNTLFFMVNAESKTASKLSSSVGSISLLLLELDMD